MNDDAINPFDDDSQDFLVLKNVLAQYSLWPLFAAVPAGWEVAAGPLPRAACIAWLNASWTDIRPLRLR